MTEFLPHILWKRRRQARPKLSHIFISSIQLVICLALLGQPIPSYTATTDIISNQRPKQDTIRLFGTVELKRPLKTLPVWLQLLARNLKDPIFQPDRIFNKETTWAQLKDGAKGKQGLHLLRYINAFWNSWPYREDIRNWNKQDYWEIPAEFLKRSGDCEDYAIIKYFTLKELGFAPDRMRIVVLRDTLRDLAHAVLVVYLDKDAYVLDNLSNAVLSHERLRHYLPQYSINESGRWAHLKGRRIP